MKHYILIGLALLALVGCGGSSSKQNNSTTITIIGTSDLQGNIEPTDEDNGSSTGGISRIAYLIKSIKETKPNAIVVSGGDDLMGIYFSNFKGKVIFDLLSLSGYELYAFGNHEFDKGTKVLSKALNYAKFKVLCSDLDVSNSPLNNKCLKYIIKDFDDIKVGFFSLMTEEFSHITNVKDVKLISNNKIIAKEMVKKLKNLGADIIVAVTHIGEESDIQLAKSVSGIDIIYGSHSHEVTLDPIVVNNTIIINGGEKGEYLMELDIAITDRAFDINTTRLITHHIDESIPTDATVEIALQNYKEQLPPDVVLGFTKKSWDLRSETLRYGESDFCDMVNDLLKSNFDVDIALNNSGAFRGKTVYPAGNITDRMLQEIDEFRNNLVTLKIKGEYLKEILEHSASLYAEGGFLQIAGLKVAIDLNATPQIIEGNNIVQKGSRVKSIKVFDGTNWQDIDNTKDYSIVTNAFLLNGGDGYFWFLQYGKDITNTYTTIYAIMTSYLAKNKEMTPKDIDGRITILE